MEQYNVTGMSCAACSARVESAVKKVQGVTMCSVNLLTNSMAVEGTADSSVIISAVIQAGYGASLKEDASEFGEDTETPKMKKRLVWSLGFLLPLMYVSMGHVMWRWPLPSFFTPAGAGITEAVLALVVMVINRKFFINGFKGILHGASNMDTLVAMGSLASFGYSVVLLVQMMNLSTEQQMHVLHGLYFESSAMILTLITVGKMLEARSKGKTTDALKSLMNLTPQMAVVRRNGKEEEIPAAELRVKDLFVVRPGSAIPADGIIVEGYSAIDESALTGESIPVDKTIGNTVSCATINTSGYLVCEATHVGKDTSLAKMIRMVADVSATKAPIAKVADQVSGVFVPTVIGIAVFTFVVWMILGKEIGFALARAISVLVISCPCALGLATPVAIMVGSGVGAKNGILFKSAVSLEETGKVQIVALDKTGTITRGKPEVTDVICAEGISLEELWQVAYNLERKSEHPLAKAILSYKDGVEEEVDGFKAVVGNGLSGTLSGCQVYGGNRKFIEQHCVMDDGMKKKADEVAAQGKTALFFGKESVLLGMIAVADGLKEDSVQAIREMKESGIYVVMVTGDHPLTAEAIGKQAGVDEVVAEVLPQQKAMVIAQLQKYGKTAMVGDGINDALALTKADTGIAIGAGTDVAMDAADVVLTRSTLTDAVAAIRLSRYTLRNIYENLFWAFFYNSIGIPLAAGLFGWEMNPMFGAAAMSLSSFCVVSNALRLNVCKIYRPENRTKKTAFTKPLVSLPKTLQYELIVREMMCHHCENYVQKTIGKLSGTVSVKADYTTGKVVVETTEPLDPNVLEKLLEEAGYPLTEMKKA
ncbi:MAG: heavy metal translocating P-type ATPase [Erysipelotrichaceae bacterium]|nr:heavy metal translocating P-type ATPase [Erysipelotrichaceae bacterium]